MIAILALTAAAALLVPARPEAETKVIGFEYAFSVPAELAAGRRAFLFENRGKQGVTLEKLIAIDKVDGDVMPLIESELGVLHAPAGTAPAGMLRIDLLAGREYVLDCGFSDTDKSPPHYKLGMYGSIHVR